MNYSNESLRAFVLEEMKRLGGGYDPLSLRKFAELMDVSPSTLLRVIEKGSQVRPTVEVLAKLSAATGKSLEAIIALSYPEVASLSQPSASALLVAQDFEKLPEEAKRVIRGVINQWLSET
jgi:transcriptional regulator with XRE-family HTH domain